MANLMVTAQGNRGSVHRLGSKVVNATLQSWTHRIDVWLDSDGAYKVEIAKLHAMGGKVIEGNVSEVDS